MSPPVLAKILMVDDQPSNLLVLRALLDETDRELVAATSGREALRCLLESDFALILLDVQMPGLDGLETAALIRQRDRSRRTPIIFLTANDSSDVQAFRGYSVGAVDYLVKPLNPAVLKAKVGVFVDLHRTTEEVRRQGERLRESERTAHERQRAEERLRQDMRVAGDIQRRLLPAAPPAVAGLDIYGASLPTETTGGDFFDFLATPDGLAVAVGDVCGHGIGPALLMATTRAYLRALTLAHTPLDQRLAIVNRALASDVAEHLFVTLFAGQFDPAARTFRYASAGHEPAWVFGPDGRVKAKLESLSFPLAVVPDGDFPEGEPVHLDVGDLLLMYTDGVVEAGIGDAEPFGRERTLDVVRRLGRQPARDIVQTLFDDVWRFVQPSRPPDDVTVVVIKVVEPD